ncbi:MAG: sulfurtransferase [Deltaproteobacteria bacterium]|nr:MAG: sulfurtransferase [Deltaproteobacteria bacterium]
MIEGFEVTVDTVKKHMKDGDSLFFVNLRHHRDWDTAIYKARGALCMPDDEVEQHLDEILHERTIVIYSICPGDESSIRAAQLLQQHGFKDVHPLIGGFNAYLQAGLPVEEIDERGLARKMMWL